MVLATGAVVTPSPGCYSDPSGKKMTEVRKKHLWESYSLTVHLREIILKAAGAGQKPGTGTKMISSNLHGSSYGIQRQRFIVFGLSVDFSESEENEENIFFSKERWKQVVLKA